MLLLWKWVSLLSLRLYFLKPLEMVSTLFQFVILLIQVEFHQYPIFYLQLTNTDGRMMIEGPPSGPYGRFYELHEQFKDNSNKDFKVFHVTIYDAQKNGLVTQEFINEKKQEIGPLFAQTYECSFDIGSGNVFESIDIDKAIELGNELQDIPISQKTLKICGLDPGWGSSPFGLVMCELLPDKQKVVVRLTETFTRQDPDFVKDYCFDLYRKYWNLWFLVDSSNAAFVNLLKSAFNESLVYNANKISPNAMKVCPVPFNKFGDQMLQHLAIMLNKQLLGVPSKFTELIRSLRTATGINYKLQKDRMVNSDLLDA